MVVSTGDAVLDKALDGGLPENRSHLVTGGPGTGKSTFAINFLQAGLEAGERCLYISTEQTPREIDAAFEAFDFDIDHGNLAVTSIHAAPGTTIEEGEGGLTLQTRGANTLIGTDFNRPFSAEYIEDHLKQFAPCDRVVFDSLSGIRPTAETDDRFHKITLDLITLFDQMFDATSLFTAERTIQERNIADVDYHPSEFKFNGVFRLWRDDVSGEHHRFIEILKMRGVDHDLRRYELHLHDGTIRVVPRSRTLPPEFVQRDRLTTGIDGFDDLLGGGLLHGTTAVLSHDGTASVRALLVSTLAEAVADDAAVVLVPPVNLRHSQLESLFRGRVGDVETLLEEDRLFVVNAVESDASRHRNVFSLEEGDPNAVFEAIDDRQGERTSVNVINTATLVQILGESNTRELRYRHESTLHGEDDITLYSHDPETISEPLAAFYRDGAQQVVSTWLDETGLQYVKAEKSPGGTMGSTRLVEYTEEKPHVSVLPGPASLDR